MKLIAVAALTIAVLSLGACANMEDCCECLQQNEALDCELSHTECVDACFKICEPTRACYCSDAQLVGCEAECGCDR